MLIRSEPRCPADRQRLGDYALTQNHADRSEPLLNAVMDARFEPVHRTWTSLWALEQRAEAALKREVAALRDAEQALGAAFDALLAELSPPDGSPETWLTPFLPPGPLSRRASSGALPATALTPLVQALPDARPSAPSPLETQFQQRYRHAMALLARRETARRSLTEARSERRAADDGWGEAYQMYHLTVEFVCRSDPAAIRRWILPWPPAG